MRPDGEHLQRSLRTKEVFSIAAGAMISTGLFVLPAVVYLKAGPSILTAYLLASIFIVPAMFSKAELATAMPKSGGVYFFINRSFGGLFGTFTGFASWFSLSLKSAFALIGIGVFLEPLVPVYSPDMIKYIALGFMVIFTILNLLSVEASGRVQFIMVAILLVILTAFVIFGLPHVDMRRFHPYAAGGWEQIFLVTGMIFISYGGLTKVASIAEEVHDPTRSIPRGMFTAFVVVSVLYILSIIVTVGVLPVQTISTTLTPLSTAARTFLGAPGYIILSIGAMMAFVTTANAGLMAASRSPMAMSRDNMLPPVFRRVSSRFNTPYVSILLTSVFMSACIVFLDIESLVKVASTMKLLMFSLVNISVILMRQSRIVSYRPTFRSPLYPYLQIAGSLVYVLLILQMGRLPLILAGVFFLVSVSWYYLYVRPRVSQKSAFIHLVENLTNKEIVENEVKLEEELIDILRERDQIVEDRFDTVISRSPVMDMDHTVTREEFFAEVAKVIGERWGIDVTKVEKKLQEREEQASTLIYPGVAVPHAIPHIIIEGKHSFDIVLVRNKYGIVWNDEGEVVYTAFCLVGSKDERNFHLKALMSIAQVLQDPEFHKQWTQARTPDELRSVILLTKRRRN